MSKPIIEGSGTPGYDLPIVKLVTFKWRGKTWSRYIEAFKPSATSWFANRGIASVLRANGVKEADLALEIYKLKTTPRESQLKVVDVSASTPVTPTSMPTEQFWKGLPRSVDYIKAERGRQQESLADAAKAISVDLKPDIAVDLASLLETEFNVNGNKFTRDDVKSVHRTEDKHIITLIDNSELELTDDDIVAIFYDWLGGHDVPPDLVLDPANKPSSEYGFMDRAPTAAAANESLAVSIGLAALLQEAVQNFADNPELARSLFDNNVGLAHSLAERWIATHPSDREETHQRALVALTRAADRFEPEKADTASFIPYAKRIIWNEFNRIGYEEGRWHERHSTTLDQPLGDDEEGATKGDVVGDETMEVKGQTIRQRVAERPGEGLEKEELREVMARALERLRQEPDKREARLVELISSGETLIDASKKLGFSRVLGSILRDRAYAKMREWIRAEGYDATAVAESLAEDALLGMKRFVESANFMPMSSMMRMSRKRRKSDKMKVAHTAWDKTAGKWTDKVCDGTYVNGTCDTCGAKIRTASAPAASSAPGQSAAE